MRLIGFVLAGTLAAVAWSSQEAANNKELALIFEADQADRKLPVKEIDWQVVSKRDGRRLARVKELYQEGQLETGRDWFRAAVVLQHSQSPDDHLLAHEMCIAALALGEKGAASLAAATEDRFLRGISRKQRFGTQFTASGPDAPLLLAETDEGVTDQLRAVLNVPPLPAPGAEFSPEG